MTSIRISDASSDLDSDSNSDSIVILHFFSRFYEESVLHAISSLQSQPTE
jgi:hypothetical protein